MRSFWSNAIDDHKTIHEFYLGKNMENHKIKNLVRKLKEVHDFDIPLEKAQAFSNVLKGDTKSRKGWRLLYVALPRSPRDL